MEGRSTAFQGFSVWLSYVGLAFYYAGSTTSAFVQVGGEYSASGATHYLHFRLLFYGWGLYVARKVFYVGYVVVS